MGKKYVIDEETLVNIANAIRENGNIPYQMFPAFMPEEISNAVNKAFSNGYFSGEESGLHAGREQGRQEGYDEGKIAGHSEGVTEGIEQGKQEAYDAFWDNFQQNGKRVNYYNGFSGYGWNETIFLPKYDIKPTNVAYGLFMYNRSNVDLVELAEKQGIVIDTSKATSLQYAFASTKFTRLGVIDATNTTNCIRAFEGNDYLTTIDKIILKDTGTTSLSNAFNGSGVLKEVRFEGVIGISVSFSACPLTKESILSIINHLSDTSSSQTLTLKSSAVGAVDWSDTVIDDVTYNTFDEICDLKPNWTISLV